MATISMRFFLLFAIVATACTLTAAFQDRGSMGRGRGGSSFPHPGTPPFNPGSRGGLPDYYKNMRFRREAAETPEVVNTAELYEAPEWVEIERYPREIPQTEFIPELEEYY